MTITAPALIESAADLIVNRGLNRDGNFVNPVSGCLCVLAALAYAYDDTVLDGQQGGGLDPEVVESSVDGFWVGVDSADYVNHPANVAEKAIRGALPKPYTTVHEWNDKATHTADEVAAFLRDVAKTLA